jgi:hypothetical protein
MVIIGINQCFLVFLLINLKCIIFRYLFQKISMAMGKVNRRFTFNKQIHNIVDLSTEKLYRTSNPKLCVLAV